jgi:hypothetical protein
MELGGLSAAYGARAQGISHSLRVEHELQFAEMESGIGVLRLRRNLGFAQDDIFLNHDFS